jgi:tetratricopeptide (TPR) repeat protein
MKRLITLTVIFSISALLSCSNDPEVDTDAAHQNETDGWTAYNQGDFSNALLSFERAINLDPNRADAHNGLGWSHLSASRVSSINAQLITKAKGAFEEAIRGDASNADAWIGLANTLFLRRENASDFQTALRAIDNALGADHRFLFRHDYRSAADLHALKAACYYYLGETELARTSIAAALQNQPENAAAQALGELLRSP